MGSKIDSFLEKLGVKEPDDIPEPQDMTEGPVEPQNRPAEPVSGGFRRSGDSKVVDMSSSSMSLREKRDEANSAKNPMKVVVINPKDIDDCQQIADCLKEKRPVVINLENVEEQVAVRIIDFISGTIYALDGGVNKISRSVWLFSPKNVNVAVSQQSRGFTDMPWETK